MTKFHMSDDGVPRECDAKIRCPLGDDTPHGEFSSPEEAQAWAETVLETQAADYMAGISKNDTPRSDTEINGDTLDILVGNAEALSWEMEEYAGGDIEEVEEARSSPHKKRNDLPINAVYDILEYMTENQKTLNATEVDSLLFYVSAAESQGVFSQNRKPTLDLYKETYKLVDKFIKDEKLEPGFDRQSHFDPNNR